MKIMSLSEVKMKLSELVENICATEEEIVITKNGRPAAVMVSPNEFEGRKESIEIKADKELMAEIKKGLSGLKQKEAKLYTLEELCE
jgi:antitoxin YefM